MGVLGEMKVVPHSMYLLHRSLIKDCQMLVASYGISSI